MKNLVETSKEVISEVSVGKTRVVRLSREAIERFDGIVSKSTKDAIRNDVVFFQDEGFDEQEIASYFAYLAARYL